MKKYIPYLAALALSSSMIFSPLSTSVFAKNTDNRHPLTNMTSTASNDFQKNILVVKTKKNSPMTKKQLHSINAKIISTVNELNYTAIKFNNEGDLNAALQSLHTYKNIQTVNLSPTYKLLDTGDAKASKQYMHKMVKSDEAQKIAGKTKVKVGVIDGGIDSEHPDLQANMLSNKNITNPFQRPTPINHGTHVAGIIAAEKNNGIGGYGINPNAQILGYDVFDAGEDSSDYFVAKAIIRAADDGVKVINMSLGSPYSSELLNSAIQYAHKKGVTIVAASGNSSEQTKFYPASYDHVISVNALNDQKKKAGFSTFGVSTDISAPGEDVYSTSYQKRGHSYENLSGTSMASPVVAGVASLLLSKHPKLTPDQVTYILEQTADDLGEKGFDREYANGAVNALAALQFDIKKLPSVLSQQWTDDKIVKEATPLQLNNKTTNSFKTAYDQHWYAIPVEKGQKLQVSAQGDKNADLKLDLNFYANGNKEKSSVNEVNEGIEESKYVEAPFTGTLVVGVHDINGLKSVTPYSLDVQSGEFSEDESSKSAVKELDSLNNTITNQYMNPSDKPEGDEDVFHFKATNNELVELNFSNIPGVKTNISVYEEHSFSANAPLNVSDAIVSSNSDEKEDSNRISFDTQIGKNYYVVLSNRHIIKVDPTNMDNPSIDDANLLAQPEPSLRPYSISFQTKSIPADEDSMNKTTNLKSLSTVENSDELIDLFNKDGLPFDLKKGVKGYVNSSDDIDGFYFTPTESAIYKMDINAENIKTIPLVSLYEMKAPLEASKNTGLDIYKIEDNIQRNATNGKTVYWSLQANTTYLIKVEQQPNQSIPLNGYEITPTFLKANPQDQYEDNNTPTTAKDISTQGSVVANFSSKNDIDHYYFTAKDASIVSVKYKMMKPINQSNPLLDHIYSNIYLSSLTVVKDANKNKKIDDDEMDMKDFIGIPSVEDFSMSGSFETKKGESYFIMLKPMAFLYNTFSLQPYSLNVHEVQMNDEDENNIVTKNIPSEPISMTKKAKNYFERSAYLKSNQLNGDRDWFTYEAKKKGKATISLAIPKDLDGVIEVYKNNKLIKTVDTYGDGDEEKFVLPVTKGHYYFKVYDHFKRSSLDAYTFSIKTN